MHRVPTLLRAGAGWVTARRTQRAGIFFALALIGLAVAPLGEAGAREDPLRIVSLGDSYTSGTGVGTYDEGQGPGHSDGNNRRRNDRSGANCYQSRAAYPWLYAERLSEDEVDAVVRHAACHGARLRDVRDQWETVAASPDGTDAGFLTPDIILLSVGGNDAGFASMVESCLVFVFRVSACQRVLDSAEQDLDRLVRQVETEVEWLHGQAPEAKIALVTYPHLTSPTCVLNWAASRRIRSLQEDHVRLAEEMAVRVNARFGLPVVEVIDPSGAFSGRGPCALTDRLVHVINLDVQESFHPTRQGHEVYADVLFRSGIHNRLLESPTSAPPAGPSVDARQAAFDEFAANPGLHRGHSTILRLYWAVFDRVPDVGGARFWVEAYDSGDWSTRQIARHFAVSTEFTSTYGSELADEQFVRLVYRNTLDREPDSVGRVFWSEQLATGMERSEMILLVSNDSEFIARHPLPSDDRTDTGPRL